MDFDNTLINKTRSIISALLPSSPVNQIKKVFNAASHKKVSDHLTKAQRKNIDAWKRQVLVRILITTLTQSHNPPQSQPKSVCCDF